MTGSLGTVEKWKLADVVLLDANPLDDIRNTKRIVAVVANGRYFSTELNKMLGEVEACAHSSH
jgi:imidazolonepropionase-like amidohydrolase